MRQLIRFDWAMKRLLRSKANFGILDGFLSELLKQDLKILNLLESESNKEEECGKLNRVDLLAKLETGELVLIEIQVNSETDYFMRMLYGVSKIISEHLKEGDPYSQVKKVFSINILYFDLGQGEDYIYHGTTSFIGLHQKDILTLTDKQKGVFRKERLYEIYPEYYLIKVNQFNEIAKDTIDEWIYFLKTEEIKDSFHAKGLIEAKEKLDSLKLSPKEQAEYQAYVTNLTYQKSMVISNYEEGRYTGRIEGRAEGETIGLAKGKSEALKAVAINLFNQGMTIAQVAKITELSILELEQLKSKNTN
jgi:predicted transposase/invertase (TIGR01784 family)